MLDRISDGLSPAGDLQLGEDAADVGLHRGEADNQSLCDLLVAVTLHNEVQDFPLSFGQVIDGLFRLAGCMDQRRGRFGGERRSARGCVSDRLGQLL